MNTPLISVVMSAYNAEKFIKKATQSILNQTYNNFEFIIINDGSTDKTKQIIQNFTDKRIVFIDKKQNAGLVSALNDGIKIAKGEYIARMDADDESLPQRFALQMAFMQKNLDIDVLGTAMFWIDGKRNNKIITQPENHQQCLNVLLNNPCIFHPTVMIRKSALDNVGYDGQYPNAEDYKLWVDLAKNGAKFANLQQPLLKYNFYGGNISIIKSNEQKKYAKMAQKAYLSYFLNNRFAIELDLLFGVEKTMSLQILSKFYGKLSDNKKQSMRMFFKNYIKNNIKLIDCKFNGSINLTLLFYYIRYNIKHHIHRKPITSLNDK